MDWDSDALKMAQAEGQAPLLEGYLEMAADREREMEAEEWAEALIHDAFEFDDEPVR